MALYKIEWKNSAVKDLKQFNKSYISKILHEIESLSQNPRPHGCKKLIDTQASYRIRLGDYRVIYQVDDENELIVVYYIRHRKEVYRKV